MKTTKILYTCPICNTTYPTPEEAVKCAEQPFDKGGYKVGDLVVIPGKWSSWYEGDPKWIAFRIPPDLKSIDHFDHVEHIYGWYVVTSIGRDRYQPHDAVLHMATRYMLDEVSGGWTPAVRDTHCFAYRRGEVPAEKIKWHRFPAVIPAPHPKVVREAARLAKRYLKFTNLI